VRTGRKIGCGMVLLAAGPFGGCAHHPAVQGKVIRGEIAFVGAVDGKDPRLTGPGLEGATVTARGTGNRSELTLGAATSNARGEFGLSLSDQNALLSTVEFWGHKPGHMDARTTMPVPTSDRKLLVILPERAPGASGGR
jgi:hypothetical protein